MVVDARTRRAGDIENFGELRLERLGPAPNPPELEVGRGEIVRMMPRVDFPEMLLEIFARTGAVDCFTHISGATTRMDELQISLCAVIVAEACNLGLVPVVNPAVRALTRGRLRHVDAAYMRPETISAANARLIAACLEPALMLWCETNRESRGRMCAPGHERDTWTIHRNRRSAAAAASTSLTRCEALTTNVSRISPR